MSIGVIPNSNVIDFEIRSGDHTLAFMFFPSFTLVYTLRKRGITHEAYWNTADGSKVRQ